MLERLKLQVAIWEGLAKNNFEDANQIPQSPLGPWFRARGDVYRHCADSLNRVIADIEKEMENDRPRD